MFSIVVIYNNERTLNKTLLKSLNKQTAKFEVIALDNTKKEFRSASEALNYGGRQANGKYIMFVHQDVELDSNSWLENAEKILNNIPDLGVAGVAGMSEKGKTDKERGRGYISSSGRIWELSNPIREPEEVQTLDACLLIVPKSVFSKIQFDEKTFDGWHCYDADYCLRIMQIGLKPYVIPAFIYHWSLGSDVRNLLKYQYKLYSKHAKRYKNIYTTCGKISRRVMIRLPIESIKSYYNKLFPTQIDYLKRELSDCVNVLDLGCGYNSPIRFFSNIQFSVGVELFEPHLQESQKKNIHDQYIKADIRKIEFKDNSFDTVLALNVMEYMTNEEGHVLIQKMENWARNKIIIITQNGYLRHNDYDKNPLQEHRFWWGVKELEKLGFTVYGINGWKKLRRYEGEIKYKPNLFWRVISNLTQKIIHQHPKYAFQLLGVKELR